MRQNTSSSKPKQKRASQGSSKSPTPLLIVLGGILLLAIALFALWKSGQPAGTKVTVEVKGKPSLRVDRDEIDLGEVPLGKTVSTSFVISNAGDQPLRIQDAPYVEVVEGC